MWGASTNGRGQGRRFLPRPCRAAQRLPAGRHGPAGCHHWLEDEGGDLGPGAPGARDNTGDGEPFLKAPWAAWAPSLPGGAGGSAGGVSAGVVSAGFPAPRRHQEGPVPAPQHTGDLATLSRALPAPRTCPHQEHTPWRAHPCHPLCTASLDEPHLNCSCHAWPERGPCPLGPGDACSLGLTACTAARCLCSNTGAPFKACHLHATSTSLQGTGNVATLRPDCDEVSSTAASLLWVLGSLEDTGLPKSPLPAVCSAHTLADTRGASREGRESPPHHKQSSAQALGA